MITLNLKEQKIIDAVGKLGICTSKEIFEVITNQLDISYATTKRIISNLISINYLSKSGVGKGTKYCISPIYQTIRPINVEDYYQKEIDEREIKTNFNFDMLDNILVKNAIFTSNELVKLNSLQNKFASRLSNLSDTEYKKEFERLAIDLSWKSSQIEGNTYSLLETEKLLKDKEATVGKTKEEAIMLLNHKKALDFIISDSNYLYPLKTSTIENIHRILVADLGVENNLRKHLVGITGTNYRPLDNEFQIREALDKTCVLINNKENIFEKALLVLLLISYIQPFTDGNKRTARIMSNAILINKKYCPISFRTVDSIDYKKAMLIFYEQNNLSAFKEIFINQFEFAVNTYFQA